MTSIPKTARLVCCASGQNWSSDQPNHPPDPNQPPRPPPPPPISSLFFISLFHFSNSFFFPPSALSNAFLACSCYQQREKENLSKISFCSSSITHFVGPNNEEECIASLYMEHIRYIGSHKTKQQYKVNSHCCLFFSFFLLLGGKGKDGCASLTIMTLPWGKGNE